MSASNLAVQHQRDDVFDEPRHHFFVDFFVQLYRYREYLVQSVLRDLRTKYKRSVLGYLWTMLHPLGMMAIISVVFAHVVRMPVENYAIFLFAGLLPWNYFNSTSMMSLGNIRANANLFSQVPVPKYLFIVSICVSNMVNFVLALIPLMLIMVVLGRGLSWTALAFPVVVLPLVFVTVGVSLLLAAANVFFDDTNHLAEVALQGLYFLCPILYNREVLPQSLIGVLKFNPLFLQIEFVRGVFYDAKLPDPTTFGLNFVGSVILLYVALWLFRKAEDKFLYYI